MKLTAKSGEVFELDVELDFEKSLEENASAYFERGKQAKRKLSRLKQAMLAMDRKIGSVKEKAPKKPAKKAKRKWFQAFHWFRTGSGLLVIAGRDAKSNELVVKKHLEKDDLFFHADIQGAASTVLKEGTQKASKKDLEEAAQFAAVRSKAWQQRLSSVDVYAVSKEQVSKSAKSGEALGTGAFMIYGKRQWFRKTPLKMAIGLLPEEGSFLVMAGPPSAVKTHCKTFSEIAQGAMKKSELAKRLLEKFGAGISLDQIISVLPAGGLSPAKT